MKRTILVLCILSNFSAQAEPTKVTMNRIFTHFSELVKYSHSDLKFTDPKNEEIIKKNLEGLSEAFAKTDHKSMFQLSNFGPSVTIMKEHIKDTHESFIEGHKHFAKIRLNSTFGLCMSCHTQIPKNKPSSFSHHLKSLKRADFQTELAFADFLFLTRSYKEAITSYKNAQEEELRKLDNLIKMKTETKNQLKFNDSALRKTISRQLTIYLKVENSIQKAKNSLIKLSELKQLPKFLLMDIQSWLEQLKQWKAPKKELSNENDVMAYIRNFLKPTATGDKSIGDGSFDMGLLVSSGLLSRYLYRHPKSKLTPEILYWLAISENQLNNNYLYSLGEIYLKQCVVDYPKSSAARNCFREYKDLMTLGYSGSSGTNIPADIKKEIKELESKLK